MDDEMAACCALLHVAFVTLFFGNRGSWVYYFAILILGLATLARRDRRHAMAVWGIAVLLLLSDRSKMVAMAREWSTLRPSPETLNLWATPEERAEWAKVRTLTRGSEPVLLAVHEGAALLSPGFARPVGGDYHPGYATIPEIRRKAAQLASAGMIVREVPPDWRGFILWPELSAALDGCELVWQGRHVSIYRRTRPPATAGAGTFPRLREPDGRRAAPPSKGGSSGA
jgi:hypothetical protein